jgi:hypothetical protein
MSGETEGTLRKVAGTIVSDQDLNYKLLKFQFNTRIEVDGIVHS